MKKPRICSQGWLQALAAMAIVLVFQRRRGKSQFHNGNILQMPRSLAHSDRGYSAATGAGNPVIYVAKTGRDGIHGATMASLNFQMKPKASARLFR